MAARRDSREAAVSSSRGSVKTLSCRVESALCSRLSPASRSRSFTRSTCASAAAIVASASASVRAPSATACNWRQTNSRQRVGAVGVDAATHVLVGRTGLEQMWDAIPPLDLQAELFQFSHRISGLKLRAEKQHPVAAKPARPAQAGGCLVGNHARGWNFLCTAFNWVESTCV